MSTPLFPLREILSDLRSSRCVVGISVGLVISLMAIVSDASYSALIFSGLLEVHTQRGMGLIIVGSAIMMLIAALFSSFRPITCKVQDIPSAIFAGAAAGIAISLGEGHAETAFMTVVAALMLSTLGTALFFLMAARWRIAHYVRLMPYPVVAGFIAGTGWLLTRGSLKVMTGISLTPASLPEMLQTEILLLWVPGVLYAVLMFIAIRRWSHFMILPGSIIIALLLYHGALAGLGIHVAEAQSRGLFFPSFATTRLWPAFAPADFHLVQWQTLLEQLPTLAIIPFISMLALLLNITGIELGSRQDIDLNRELLVNAGANALAGLAGSPAGYNTLSLSLLGFRTGADTRLIGLAAFLSLTSVLFWGGQILAIFPKALLGGFLFMLGLFFLSDWLADTRHRMPRADYMVVLAVFGTIAAMGYLQGVLLGILATAILFVVRFSRIPTLLAASTGVTTRSHRQRTLPQQRILAQTGHRLHVFDLGGYLFFGSVNALAALAPELKPEAEPETESLSASEGQFILADFQRVSGFDISAVNTFVRLSQRLESRKMMLVLAGASDLFANLLRQTGGAHLERNTRFFSDRQAALEWCEDQLLEEVHQHLASYSTQSRQAREALLNAVSDDLLQRLEQQEAVENLLERMAPFLETRHHAAGEVLLAPAEIAPGIFFVRQGRVQECLKAPADQWRVLRELGPAACFAESAAHVPWSAICMYRAESAAEVALLTPDALQKLEAEAPRLALQLQRLVIQTQAA